MDYMTQFSPLSQRSRAQFGHRRSRLRISKQLLRESAVARRLQTRIRQDASDPAVPNWLSRWRRDEFLRDRRPPGIFASPVFAFTMSPFPRRNDQSARAAAVTHATARFFTRATE